MLVGFMGTGKSTLGRDVAVALRRPFVDTDLRIEARAGRSIPRIFATEGEAGFRALEAAVVAEIGRRQRQVVATGGGVLGTPGNREALAAGGVLVALSARPEVILARTGGSAAGAARPLLAGADPLERIRALCAERAGLYAAADLQLDTSDLDRPAALAALLRLLGIEPAG